MVALLAVVLTSVTGLGIVLVSALFSLHFTADELQRRPVLRWVLKDKLRLWSAFVTLAVVSAVLHVLNHGPKSEIVAPARSEMTLKPSSAELRREMAAEAQHRTDIALAKLTVGDEHLRSGRFAEAVAAYRESLVSVPSKAGFVNLGIALKASSDRDGALDAFKQAMALPARSSEGKLLHAHAALQFGSIQSALGKKHASKSISRAKDEFRRQHDHLGIAASDLELARHRYSNGETTKASEHLADSTALFRALRNEPGIADAAYLKGIIAFDQGRVDEAEQAFADAEHRYIQLGNTKGEAAVAHAVGMIRHGRCDVTRALESYNNCAKLAADTGDRYLEALAIAASANMYIERRDAASALRAIEQVLQLCREVSAPDVEGWAYMYRAAAHQLAGKHDAARVDLETARTRFTDSDKLGAISTLAEEGKLLLAIGRPDDALVRLQQALADSDASTYRQLSGLIHLYMTDVYLKLGDRAKAVQSVTAARRIYEEAKLQNCERRVLDSKLAELGL